MRLANMPTKDEDKVATFTLPEYQPGLLNDGQRLLYQLVISHYLLYPFVLAGGAFSLMWLRRDSQRVVVAGVITYALSLVLYQPHKKRGWSFPWFRSVSAWDMMQTWLKPTWIREGPPLETGDGKRYIFAIAPHGILAVFRLFFEGSMWNRIFPGLERGRWVGATPQFLVPGCRELMLAFGAFDAGKRTLVPALERGESLLLTPGGSRELVLTDSKSTDTKHVVSDRKGFCKLAIEQGVDIIPVMCFGEKYLYSKLLLPGPVRKLLYTLKIPGTLFFGCCGTLIPLRTLPDGKPVHFGIVFGKPISVGPADQSPSADKLDAIHNEYMKRQVDLFERYKCQFDYAETDTFTCVPTTFKEKKDEKKSN